MSKILTLLAAVLLLATLAATGSTAAGAAQERTPIEAFVAAGGLGSDPELGSRRNAPEAADPSGAFIYRKGKYRPLDSLAGLPTAHVGVNNRGQIAGAYLVEGPTLRGFVRSRGGDYTSFDAAPGAPDVLTAPFKINDRGTIAGFYAVGSIDDPESAEFHGFLRKPNGAVTTVDVPGASSTAVFGLNSRGAVVGSFVDADGQEHGFLLDARGRVTTLDPPDSPDNPAASNTFASDINDQGRIVGAYADAKGTYHGYLYYKGRFTKIDPPEAANVPDYATTAPFAINNRRQVVGQYVDADGVLHGYLWERKRGFETIDPPQGAGTVAADIDDRGQILLPAPGALFKGRKVSIGS
jgi:probable HAF family extracellular repeat protein